MSRVARASSHPTRSPTHVVVLAFAQPSAAKIESQHGNAAAVKRLGGLVDNFVVHGPAEKGVWMANERGEKRLG
jgi:hypothetical protein